MNSRIICGDVLEVLKTLEAESVQCVVTSPPYWGLRDYGMPGQLGLEKTPDEYVAKMVEVFREVRRVLRADGTLWLNIGDSYAGYKQATNRGSLNMMEGIRDKTGFNRPPNYISSKQLNGIKPKDLCGIPWRVAFALQVDGWWLRQDIIWAKPNPMPESVMDRCTKSHEYIFLFTKSKQYYYDAEAIKEDSVTDPDSAASMMFGSVNGKYNTSEKAHASDLGHKWDYSEKRNKRSVWIIATNPYSEAHFATFPEDLIIPCIKAGTSEKGCCLKCGSPVERKIEHISGRHNPQASEYQRIKSEGCVSGGIKTTSIGCEAGYNKTIGWQPTCQCAAESTTCTVLDPFSGAGTTCMVAKKLCRNYLGIELNPKYCEMAERRIETECGTLI